MPQGSSNVTFEPKEVKLNGPICPSSSSSLVGTFKISNCFVKAVCSRLQTSDATSHELLNCELDSHADTVCAGHGFVMYEKPTRYVDVRPYSEEYKPIKNIPITTVATVWTDVPNAKQYLLLFHEALFFGDRLQQSLICPNQLRANGLIVHDVPRQFDADSTHSIRVPDSDITIPLELKGIMSCFETRAPSDEDDGRGNGYYLQRRPEFNGCLCRTTSHSCR